MARLPSARQRRNKLEAVVQVLENDYGVSAFFDPPRMVLGWGAGAHSQNMGILALETTSTPWVRAQTCLSTLWATLDVARRVGLMAHVLAHRGYTFKPRPGQAEIRIESRHVAGRATPQRLMIRLAPEDFNRDWYDIMGELQRLEDGAIANTLDQTLDRALDRLVASPDPAEARNALPAEEMFSMAQVNHLREHIARAERMIESLKQQRQDTQTRYATALRENATLGGQFAELQARFDAACTLIDQQKADIARLEAEAALLRGDAPAKRVRIRRRSS